MGSFRVAVAVMVVLAILTAAINTAVAFHVEEAEFTVKDKELVCTGGGDTAECKYLVFTDQGTYENTDSLIHMRFNSSDIHGELERGSTYKATVAGYRVPFMSLYQNIVEYQKVQ